MSWQINVGHIGSVLTIEELNKRLAEQARFANEASEQIEALGALLRNEIRRIQDVNPYSDYEFIVSAYGHADAAAKGPGSLSATLTIQWKHLEGS